MKVGDFILGGRYRKLRLATNVLLVAVLLFNIPFAFIPELSDGVWIRALHIFVVLLITFVLYNSIQRQIGEERHRRVLNLAGEMFQVRVEVSPPFDGESVIVFPAPEQSESALEAHVREFFDKKGHEIQSLEITEIE